MGGVSHAPISAVTSEKSAGGGRLAGTCLLGDIAADLVALLNVLANVLLDDVVKLNYRGVRRGVGAACGGGSSGSGGGGGAGSRGGGGEGLLDLLEARGNLLEALDEVLHGGVERHAGRSNEPSARPPAL